MQLIEITSGQWINQDLVTSVILGTEEDGNQYGLIRFGNGETLAIWNMEALREWIERSAVAVVA